LAETFDIRYGNSNLPAINRLAFRPVQRETREIHFMKDKSKAVLWICFTALVASGLKYIPPYLLEQRRMDMQERLLDLREDSFLHQKPTPTVSVPEAVHANRSQLL
jgi:hypothetical protein